MFTYQKLLRKSLNLGMMTASLFSGTLLVAQEASFEEPPSWEEGTPPFPALSLPSLEEESSQEKNAPVEEAEAPLSSGKKETFKKVLSWGVTVSESLEIGLGLVGTLRFGLVESMDNLKNTEVVLFAYFPFLASLSKVGCSAVLGFLQRKDPPQHRYRTSLMPSFLSILPFTLGIIRESNSLEQKNAWLKNRNIILSLNRVKLNTLMDNINKLKKETSLPPQLIKEYPELFGSEPSKGLGG